MNSLRTLSETLKNGDITSYELINDALARAKLSDSVFIQLNKACRVWLSQSIAQETSVRLCRRWPEFPLR